MRDQLCFESTHRAGIVRSADWGCWVEVVSCCKLSCVVALLCAVLVVAASCWLLLLLLCLQQLCLPALAYFYHQPATTTAAVHVLVITVAPLAACHCRFVRIAVQCRCVIFSSAVLLSLDSLSSASA